MYPCTVPCCEDTAHTARAALVLLTSWACNISCLSAFLGYPVLDAQVEVKTKKLKKLWSKYQTAQREVKDIQEEFQQERSDMLDTIRELTRQLKLKEVTTRPITMLSAQRAVHLVRRRRRATANCTGGSHSHARPIMNKALSDRGPALAPSASATCTTRSC